MALTGEVKTSSGSWTCPTGVHSVQVECWGAGGGTVGSTVKNTPIGGAGGGAYSKGVVSVTPGNSYSFTIGAAGSTSGGAGGDTYFVNTATVMAKGGKGATSTTGAAGGLASESVGTTKNNGGTGASGVASTYGGGGGGAGGPSNAGGNGSTYNGGTGYCSIDSPLYPGQGGNGSNVYGNGSPGLTYGGGAGGGQRTGGATSGVAGAGGAIYLLYAPDPVITHVTASTSGKVLPPYESYVEVQKKVGAGSYSTFVRLQNLEVITFTDGSTFTPGTTYYYKVRRVVDGTILPWSNESSFYYTDIINTSITQTNAAASSAKMLQHSKWPVNVIIHSPIIKASAFLPSHAKQRDELVTISNAANVSAAFKKPRIEIPIYDSSSVGIVVERSQDDLDSFRQLALITSGITYQDHTMDPTGHYYYRIMYVNLGTVSGYSNIVEVIGSLNPTISATISLSSASMLKPTIKKSNAWVIIGNKIIAGSGRMINPILATPTAILVQASILIAHASAINPTLLVGGKLLDQYKVENYLLSKYRVVNRIL